MEAISDRRRKVSVACGGFRVIKGDPQKGRWLGRHNGGRRLLPIIRTDAGGFFGLGKRVIKSRSFVTGKQSSTSYFGLAVFPWVGSAQPAPQGGRFPRNLLEGSICLGPEASGRADWVRVHGCYAGQVALAEGVPG